jgi:hypothetical protein
LVHIKQFRILMAAMDCVPPESRSFIDHGLEREMAIISQFTSNWCRRIEQLARFTRRPSTSHVVDHLASGIEAVQLSQQQ